MGPEPQVLQVFGQALAIVVPSGGQKMSKRVIDLEDDDAEQDVARYVPLARPPTDDEIFQVYPKRVFGGGEQPPNQQPTKSCRCW